MAEYDVVHILVGGATKCGEPHHNVTEGVDALPVCRGCYNTFMGEMELMWATGVVDEPMSDEINLPDRLIYHATEDSAFSLVESADSAHNAVFVRRYESQWTMVREK